MIATGALSNWDKLFPRANVVQATYSGYRPTGSIDTEIRYFLEVSGQRQMYDATQQQVLQKVREELLLKYPEDAAATTEELAILEKEAISFDEAVKAILPVYRKHFTLAELQELNKFYSTDAMQAMVKKTPFVAQDLAPVQLKMMSDFLARVEARLNEQRKGSM